MTERKPDLDAERIAQQVKLSLQRDELRDAIIGLYLACLAQQPDGQYDPADDPRHEKAIKGLAGLTGSLTIAEAIQQALAIIIMSEQMEAEKPKQRDPRVPYEALAKLPPFEPDGDDTPTLCPTCKRTVKKLNILTHPNFVICDYCKHEECELCKKERQDCICAENWDEGWTQFLRDQE